MTIIEKIKAEIERRFREYNKDSNHHLQAAEDAELLSFLSTLESEIQKSKEVLPERGALINADCLISRLDNLHNEYEEKFDQTGEVLFEQAMYVVEKVQKTVFDIKDGKKDG